MTPEQRQRLRRKFEAAWSAETAVSHADWTPERPSTGQCAVTALLVQDFYGGALLRAMAGDESHYWNRLSDGSEIDLTRDQFDTDEGWELDPVEERSREYVLSNRDTARRYELLRRRWPNGAPA